MNPVSNTSRAVNYLESTAAHPAAEVERTPLNLAAFLRDLCGEQTGMGKCIFMLRMIKQMDFVTGRIIIAISIMDMEWRKDHLLLFQGSGIRLKKELRTGELRSENFALFHDISRHLVT